MGNKYKISELAQEASSYKKAWIMSLALFGKPASISSDQLSLQPYLNSEIKPLKRHIEDLQHDLKEVFGKISAFNVSSPKGKKAVLWLSKKHDEWLQSNEAIWEIGRVQDVEQHLGLLKFREVMECPLYAQVLLQGFLGAGIRHPEYHLARDIELLNNLFFDSEAVSAESLRTKVQHGTEVNQSLARSTILTCFNLLEAFVSGLVAEYIMANPDAPDETIRKLKNPDRTRNSLAARFEDVPGIIAGKPGVMESSRPVLTQLFGECKDRRNAYVHCVPAATASARGAAKEARFHETDAAAVRKTVNVTIQAIRAAWKCIHGKDGPRWLRQPETSGCFSRTNKPVRLEFLPKTP